MNTDCVYAFGGPSKSGKTTIGKLFAQERRLRFASFGDYVRKDASRRGINNPTRAELQTVGMSLVKENLIGFCQSVLAEAGFVRGEGLVVDGVRHLATIRVLRELLGNQTLKVVYLETSFAARSQRGSTTSDDLKKVDAHPVEAETAVVKNVADFVLDTSLLTPADSLSLILAWSRIAN